MSEAKTKLIVVTVADVFGKDEDGNPITGNPVQTVQHIEAATWFDKAGRDELFAALRAAFDRFDERVANDTERKADAEKEAEADQAEEQERA